MKVERTRRSSFTSLDDPSCSMFGGSPPDSVPRCARVRGSRYHAKKKNGLRVHTRPPHGGGPWRPVACGLRLAALAVVDRSTRRTRDGMSCHVIMSGRVRPCWSYRSTSVERRALRRARRTPRRARGRRPRTARPPTGRNGNRKSRKRPSIEPTDEHIEVHEYGTTSTKDTFD